jgi:Ca-activated chloride channel homolog
MTRENCDIGLILFGGEAKHFVSSNPDKCYTRRFVDSIGFMFDPRGTAIGDAIWLAKNSYVKDSQSKKLVIIGDGDNTAGRITPELAATVAKKFNIAIYTIGIGTAGLVPFGVDSSGNPNMIENTFTDKDLKLISSITNGKFTGQKTNRNLTRS